LTSETYESVFGHLVGLLGLFNVKNPACYEMLLRIGNAEGKRSLGRPKRRWKNITMELREIKWESVDWLNLAQDRD
jgi:hypothetical protein